MLPRVVGQQRALELALMGRVLTAEEARDWGLVSEVVDEQSLHDRALEVAQVLAAQPIAALGEAKRLIRSSWEASRTDQAADEAATISDAVSNPETRVLLANFAGRGRS